MTGLSLRIKVFLLFLGATLLVVVPALLFSARAVERRVYKSANEALADAAGKLEYAWSEQEPTLVYAAQFKASSPEVGEPWAEGRMHAMTRALRPNLDNEVAIAVDTAYRPLVGPRVPREVLTAGLGHGTVVALPDSGLPLRIAVAPVFRDTFASSVGSGKGKDTVVTRRDTVRLGVIAIGTRISAQALAKAVSKGTEVALIVGDSMVSSTLPDSASAGVRRLIDRGGEFPARVLIAGEPYLPRIYPLSTDGLPAKVVLFRRITDELGVAEGIKRSLYGIGVAALLMSLVLALLVARIVARPAQALVEASTRLARGDYDAPLPRASGDEIGQLARAFGEMRAAIGERERRLRSAQAEMIHREKLAAMGRLVAQLSHEINNPIYNIQNCLEALERRGDPADPNREFLTLAQEELARMATLTRQLLDQSRPLSDAAQPVNLNALVQRVVTLAGDELRARRIHVGTLLAPGLPEVVAHPEGIQQVLANLVNNACDAMPGGGALTVHTRADAEAVEVVVEDTGMGIAEHDLPHIFEAFYTTKPGVAGIGLGLFVSEGIIRGHRGRLSVESVRGEGSRFTVRLPRETLDEAMRDETEEGGEPPADAHGADARETDAREARDAREVAGVAGG